MAEHPVFRRVALDLYKERVVGLFMATNTMLAALPHLAREALLAAFEYQVAKEGAVIVKEGSVGDDLFFVKRGEVRSSRRGRVAPWSWVISGSTSCLARSLS